MKFLRCIGILLLLGFIACNSAQKKVDSIFFNGSVYLCDSAFGKAEAFAIKEGKIIAVGKSEDIKKQFKSSNEIDLKGKTVYPGFFDAHCHFYALGKLESECNVAGLTSWHAVLDSVKSYSQRNPNQLWIVGRGWDQTLFDDKKMPDNQVLNSLFPDKAVVLRRIDGHGAVANKMALTLAGIDKNTQIKGGEIRLINGEPSGFILDNAVDLVFDKIPKPSSAQMASYLLKAQDSCLKVGLTSVVDAGLDVAVIKVIDSLFKTGDLKIRINAMLSANAGAIDFINEFGFIDRPEFKVKSLKIYTDGALGSRGALLKKEYCDWHGHNGLLLTEIDTIEKYCQFAVEHQLQVNAHAIGDSANHLILNLYGKYTRNKDLRWRIEHAQVVDTNDFKLFGKYGIIPSVQPTHATSDMRWAEERICSNRMQGAYSYQSLLKQLGVIALGTDFPIEDYKPIKTYYAAVFRQDGNQQPTDGFRLAEGLSPQQTLMGMTAWAAYAQFDEKTKGSLKPGYWADFIISERDILNLHAQEVLKWIPYKVYLAGEER